MEEDPKVTCKRQVHPRTFTWKQLSCYNRPHNAHVAYRGKVYDVSQFIAEHPGGADQIMLGAGRDITVMFDPYHPLDTHRVLEKYYVGELIDDERPTFPEMGEFYKTVKKRADAFFKANNIDPKMDYWMVVRYVFMVLTAFSFHFAMIYFHSNLVIGIISAMAAAIFLSNIALSLSHDASHYSFTHKPWVWKVLGASHDFILGTSQYVWAHQHVVGHHPYANIDGFDPDLKTKDNDQSDWRRFKITQKWFPHYWNQHLYFPLFYGLLTIRFRIRDVISVINLNYNGVRMNPLSSSQLFLFIAGKLFWVFHRIILPLYFMPWPTMSLKEILGVTEFDDFFQLLVFLTVLSELVGSYYLTFIILTSHVVERAEFNKPGEDGNMHRDWAELQVACIADYATDSWFWTVFSGAINQHITHHLLPYVLQTHIPKVAPVVIQTIKDFGLEYKCNPTMSGAVASHLAHLRNLGQNKYESPQGIANDKKEQ